MTDVLHLQSRAYPLLYRSIDPSPRVIFVPGRGKIQPVIGTLQSLAYNFQPTIEVDLTEVILPYVSLPDIEIIACRARILSAGVLLVIYALKHDTELGALNLQELDELDARMNRALRMVDAPILEEVLVSALQARLVWDITPRPDVITGVGRLPVDGRAVRYNCHLVARDPAWVPDSRVSSVVAGNGCRVLLPYTYAWNSDPSMPLGDIMTMIESTDIALAQSALLVGATIGGQRILHNLARADRDCVDVFAFRRFLDGAWADYHNLDMYRLESAQHHRANFMAAHLALDLECARQQAEEFLRYVGTSLLSESSLRSGQLDRRLNRVAAVFTVLAAGSFVLEAANFLLRDPTRWMRAAVVAGVVTLVAGVLAVTLVIRRHRETTRG